MPLKVHGAIKVRGDGGRALVEALHGATSQAPTLVTALVCVVPFHVPSHSSVSTEGRCKRCPNHVQLRLRWVMHTRRVLAEPLKQLQG